MANEELESVLCFDELRLLDDSEIAERIARAIRALCIGFPMDSVGRTNDPTDIASDYLDAAYFGERLARHCSSINVRELELKHGILLGFDVTVADTTSFIRELRRLISGFDPDDDYDDTLFRDEVANFEETIFDTPPKLWHLADNYVGNFLNGSLYYENRRECNKEHPTWRWGFWRSFGANQMRADIYLSDMYEGMWIVLGDRAAAEKLLAEYGGFSVDGARLHAAASLRIAPHPHVAITVESIVSVPSARIAKALTCWRRCIAPESAKKRKGRGDWEYRYGLQWAMTEGGDAIVCSNEDVSFVAFTTPEDRLRPEAVRDLIASMEGATGTLHEQIGLGIPPFNWSLVSPDDFEELCYQVLLRSGRFDESRFRKHGKTRSRDGGRDIEAWTLPRLNEASKKWIFQCKLITTNKALAASKVNVADVVDQYSARGFGVMTNELIDSTLYDKIDAIVANRSLGKDTWDGPRLQRFISSRRDLLRRYFPETQADARQKDTE